MKKLLLLTAFTSFCFFSCSEDEPAEELEPQCLVCTAEDPTLLEGSEFPLCEGDISPQSGQPASLADLQTGKAILEGLGATCTLQ